MDIRDRLASNILMYSKARKITLTELAKRMGVSNQTTSCWSRGEKVPRLNKLSQLCSIFDCTLGDLIESDQDEESIRMNDATRRLLMMLNEMTALGVEKVQDYCRDIYPTYKR